MAHVFLEECKQWNVRFATAFNVFNHSTYCNWLNQKLFP